MLGLDIARHECNVPYMLIMHARSDQGQSWNAAMSVLSAV
jgi:hypothetical protein